MNGVESRDRVKRVDNLIARYRVTCGENFRLRGIGPGDPAELGFSDEAEVTELLARGVDSLAERQDLLYAQDRWGLLLLFQAMDTADTDVAIEHVTSGIDPKGCRVVCYRQPSSGRLDRDFFWRYMRDVPARGQIGVCKRSYYDELLVVKVHEERAARQKLRLPLGTNDVWKKRYENVGNYEQYLNRNGFLVVKFFLHISNAERRRRFKQRREQREHGSSDLAGRKYWPEYHDACEEAIRNTASDHSPWYVVPADNRWFTRLVVAYAVAAAIDGLKLQYPVVGADKRNARAVADRSLAAD